MNSPKSSRVARGQPHAGLLLELAVGGRSRSPRRARGGRRPAPTSPGRCAGARRAPAAGSSRARSTRRTPANRCWSDRWPADRVLSTQAAAAGATSAVERYQVDVGQRVPGVDEHHLAALAALHVAVAAASYGRRRRGSAGSRGQRWTSSKRPRSVRSSGASTTPVSSASSRTAPATGSSPRSRPPPGKHHRCRARAARARRAPA